MTSASSEGDLVKALNGDDVISKVTEEPVEETLPEQQTEDTSDADKNCDVTDEIAAGDCDENSDRSTTDGTSEDTNGAESTETSQACGNDGQNSLTPLVQELTNSMESVPSVEASEANDSQAISENNGQTQSSQNDDVTIDLDDVTQDNGAVTSDASFDDPVEALVNFFYTSHINITSKNVGKLRACAQQCGVDDVTVACDAFDNLLETETSSLSSDAEKEKVATNIR